MHDMEEMLQRIQKISKLIQVAMNICWVIFGFMILLGFVVAIVPFVTNIDLITFHSEIVSSANLLPIDIIDYIFGDTHLKLQIVLSGLFISMMGGVFTAFLTLRGSSRRLVHPVRLSPERLLMILRSSP